MHVYMKGHRMILGKTITHLSYVIEDHAGSTRHAQDAQSMHVLSVIRALWQCFRLQLTVA